jgi:hypothetical protein
MYARDRHLFIDASHQALRGGAKAHLMQGDATLQRLAQEIERRKKEPPTEADAPGVARQQISHSAHLECL